jgi:hypothetical protein
VGHLWRSKLRRKQRDSSRKVGWSFVFLFFFLLLVVVSLFSLLPR